MRPEIVVNATSTQPLIILQHKKSAGTRVAVPMKKAGGCAGGGKTSSARTPLPQQARRAMLAVIAR